MTTIIAGVLPSGSITMLADHRTTFGGEYHDSAVSPKAAIVGNMIFGVAGDAATIDPLLYDWLPPTDVDDVMLHMHTCIIPQLRERIGEVDDDANWQMLIGYRSQLLYITKDFAVVPTDLWFASIGSGSAYALGNLYARKPGPRPLVDAMEAASAFDVYTSPSFTSLTLP